MKVFPVFAALALAAGSLNAVDFISHRGESADAPENTLAAFRLAWERDADGIELDIHLSRDGEVMVMHDGNTGRTSGVKLEISQSTAEELRQLDVGSFKGEQYKGEKIPFLAEALAEVPAGKKVFIELKSGEAELVEKVAALCAASGLEDDQVVIISFNRTQVERSARAMPDYRRYLLDGWNWNKEAKDYDPSFTELIRRGESCGADGLDLAGWAIFTQEAYDAWRDAGLLVGVWTIDDLERAVYYYHLGVDAITSNKAGELKKLIVKGEAE